MADSTGLSDIVRRAAQANAKLYKGWMDLSLDYLRGLSEIFSGATSPTAPVQEMDSGAGALVLEGEVGRLVRGSFLVSNDLERPVSCDFVSSDFKDPAGASLYAKADFDPPSLELGPGEQRVVRVAIAIDDSLSPGVGYAGEISIRGMDGFAVPVVLRRQHRVDESPVPDEQSGAAQDESKPNASQTSRPKATVKKGGKKKRAR